MSSRRNVALALAAWLVVVVAGAALVWTVISRAGEGVAGADQPAGQSSLQPSTQEGRRTPAPPDSRGPDSQLRTWKGAAGYVTAECAGQRISIAQASPYSGYRIEQDDAGPDEIRVEFETHDGDDRTRVEAACQDGVPVFEVDD